MTTPRKPILCLDFDGTLSAHASGWQGARTIPDAPVDGAMVFLVEAVDHFEVAIHSSRSRYWGGRKAMRRWLERQLVDHFWASHSLSDRQWLTPSDYEEHYALRAQALVRRISFPLFKPPAHVTLDDRAVTFEGKFPSISYLQEFKPWNRRAA